MNEALKKLLLEIQEALDVLAEDAEEAGYPTRAKEAANLAQKIREAIRKN
jgi:hypothetical protein